MGLMGSKTSSNRSSKHFDFKPPTTNDSIGRSYTVVWCDAAIGTEVNAEDDSYTLLRLTRIVNKKRQLIHAFNELVPCQEFLNQVNNVCLIVSGAMGYQLVPLVHNLEQIHSIYIFCMDREKHAAWAKHYHKVRGVYTDIEDVCDQLKTYFFTRLSLEYDQFQCDISPKDHFELPLIYSICSKQILSHMQSTKEEMIEYCQQQYPNDYQLSSIDKFDKEYDEHSAIWWFTKDRFYQEILNQALSTNDLYSLSAMNFFIRDLDNQLIDLQNQAPRMTQPLTLYFSYMVANEDFDKIKSNPGGLMCINEFLLANTERTIAYLYLQDASSTPVNGKMTNVLFRMTIPSNINANVAFANIGEISQFVHLKEYLFSMGSLFRIDKTERLNDFPSAWTVHISLIDINDAQYQNLTRHIEGNYLHEEYDLDEVASTIKSRLSQFSLTRQFFEQSFNWKLKPIQSTFFHLHMAMIYNCFDEPDKALEAYRLIIKSIRDSTPNGHQEDHFALAPFYSMLGLTYQQKNIASHAFTYAFRTLGILSKYQKTPIYRHDFAVACQFNLAQILEQQGRLAEAKTHYGEALKSQLQYLPSNHPDVILARTNINRIDTRINETSQPDSVEGQF